MRAAADIGRGAGARWVCGLMGVLWGMLAVPAAAQEADTLGAPPPDTVAVRPGTAVPPPAFVYPAPGEVVGMVLPARTPALDPVEVLGTRPGTFVYDFGTPGWPHGWSPYGLSPNQVGLYLDGLPLADLVTGRPRYDLLPFTFVKPLRVQLARDDVPAAVHGTLRPFAVAEPLTEMRYRTSNTGLQSVTVVHAQERRPMWFGGAGRLNVVFGYGGHAVRGEYPGSRLRRARQVLLRVRYQRPGWAVEVKELFNRRRVGAHGGVLPVPGAPYTSIYQRLGARVDREEARRETFRNDLALSFHARLARGLAPFGATAFWTNERLQYRNASDTLTARLRRVGVQVHQRLAPGRHRLWLRADLWREAVRDGRALPDTLGLRRTRLHLSARDTVAAGPLRAVLEGGYHVDDDGAGVTGFGRLAWERRGGDVFVEASRARQPRAWVARHGFGPALIPLAEDERSGGAATLGRAGFTLRWGALTLHAFGYGLVLTDPLDLYVVAGDTVAARVHRGTWRRVGLAGELGLRQDAERGLYLVLRPTLSRFLDRQASADHRRAADALPRFFGEARLGARFVLFQNDLDLDVYVRGRYWGAMRSRTLHPPTGLLALPEEGARPVEAAGTLDLFVSAGVRTASLFLAYENVLSGTSLLVGNLIVPDYPLPQRRLRFGVFWPIFN